jgi:hypothetical protein
MKLHLVSALNPAVTACGRSLQAFGTRAGECTTTHRSLFRRRANAKPEEVCVWCGRVDDADARREYFQRRGEAALRKVARRG